MKRGVVLAVTAAVLAVATAPGRASSPLPVVFSADRAPTVTGEIYRVDPNGHRVDLSRSPSQDTSPAVSPDGKHVAFISSRSGNAQVYEVGSDGRGLHRLVAASVSNLAWQPHGSLLAVEESGNEVRIVAPNGTSVVASRHSDWFRWSPDGRILLVYDLNGFHAVSPRGSTLWSAFGDYPSGEWSLQGLLAVPLYHGAAVYDEQGRRVLKFPLSESSATFSWSPDGRYLASLTQGALAHLEVRTVTGTLLFTRKGLTGDMAWAGNSTLVVGIAGCASCKTTGIDIRTGKTVHASQNWLDPRSADGKLAIVTPASGQGFTLGAARPAGGAATTYARISGCYSDGGWTAAVTSPQFAGRSIVYQSWGDCDAPFANLYSFDTSVHRLTNVRAQETQPALSPDGTQIAYVWASNNGISCSGCSDGIRIAGADGTPIRTLTNPDSCTFDDSPSWSPDGTTIIYAEDTCSNPDELFTVPAAGGAPHDLGVAGGEPAWGPTRIAYVGAKGLMTANPDGSDPVLVAKRGGMPAWSLTGRLAYLAGKTLVVGTTQATLPFASVKSLAWTPDGTRLVLAATMSKSGALDLYSVKPDGTDPIRLTTNYGVAGKPPATS
ncbi:MAG TPA: LpqB family beta-propeller domain-containing protein [Gaiellaceae bacterium]|nr:LpqB family beta-propeller domain-containing protein [Gaiellaceae bacterium]